MILDNKNEFYHKKLKKSLKYLYGFNKYDSLKDLDLEFRLSKKVNKIKEIKHNEKTLFTFRNNGTISFGKLIGWGFSNCSTVNSI